MDEMRYIRATVEEYEVIIEPNHQIGLWHMENFYEINKDKTFKIVKDTPLKYRLILVSTKVSEEEST